MECGVGDFGAALSGKFAGELNIFLKSMAGGGVMGQDNINTAEALKYWVSAVWFIIMARLDVRKKSRTATRLAKQHISREEISLPISIILPTVR